MAELTPGAAAPEFSLPAADGTMVSLRSLRGKKVVLYFYPKDDTPGCTREACSFRDNFSRIAARGAEVIGVSKDSSASHTRFAAKYELPFRLLTDQSGEVIKAYGALKRKSLWGKSFLGIERTTVIIDERGRVVRVFPKVKVDGHVDEVLQAL